MASAYSERLQKLMKSFTRLPGIGPKSAERIVLHLLKQDKAQAEVVCVVEEPKDVASIERTASYNGVYHVLLGALSPLEGIGPKELRIDRFIKRASSGKIKEVILATNPNAEGDATALYLIEALKPFKHIKITRIARGVPLGTQIEYIDQATLQSALEGRTTV